MSLSLGSAPIHTMLSPRAARVSLAVVLVCNVRLQAQWLVLACRCQKLPCACAGQAACALTLTSEANVQRHGLSASPGVLTCLELLLTADRARNGAVLLKSLRSLTRDQRDPSGCASPAEGPAMKKLLGREERSTARQRGRAAVGRAARGRHVAARWRRGRPAAEQPGNQPAGRPASREVSCLSLQRATGLAWETKLRLFPHIGARQHESLPSQTGGLWQRPGPPYLPGHLGGLLGGLPSGLPSVACRVAGWPASWLSRAEGWTRGGRLRACRKSSWPV